ncbi:MAG: cell division protein FtsL [Magnetococcales bacterium]|nr:cell division protein FtsL [Magnetococcales bacterium]NGZ28547.1 cell division protein FtsL [Magnetococcales bacterium]
MKIDALLIAILVALLAATSAGIVSSRTWMQKSHREFKKAEVTLQQLAEKEEALKIEWINRSDLNQVELRARQELGMRPPRADQWRLESP